MYTVAFIYIILYNNNMDNKNFYVIEEFDTLSSNNDLARAINKYVPRAAIYHFREFTTRFVDSLPKEFYSNNYVICSCTNDNTLIDYYMSKFAKSTWNTHSFKVNSRKKDAFVHFYYYIDTKNNLVTIVYTNAFSLKQQTIPYRTLEK